MGATLTPWCLFTILIPIAALFISFDISFGPDGYFLFGPDYLPPRGCIRRVLWEEK